MSVNAQKRSRKRLRLLALIGLPIALLIGILLWFRRKKGWLWVVRKSEYAKYEPWFIAQSQHETANWKSSLFKNHNSLFGFKMSDNVDWKGYQGPLSPEGDYYAGYYKWSDSANHLLNWLRYTGVPTGLTSVEQYVKALHDRGYFTDTVDNYTNGVKRFL